MLSEAKARSFCGTPLWLIQVRLLERLVAILFEHRKSNSHERACERGARTIQ